MNIFVYSNTTDRYNYHLCKYFAMTGHQVLYMRDDYIDSTYLKAIYQEQDIKVVNSLPDDPENWIFISGLRNTLHMDLKWKRIICWNPTEQPYAMPRHARIDKYIAFHFEPDDLAKLNCCIINFVPHPLYYMQREYEKRRSIEKKELLAACILNNGDVYGDSSIRRQLVSRLLNLGDRYVHILKEKVPVKKLPKDKIIVGLYRAVQNKRGFLSRIVFGDKQQSEGVSYEYEEWLDLLCNSKYSIVIPGFGYKDRNHRSIESLMCGSVPVMTYGDMFNPTITEDEAVLYNETTFAQKVLSIFDIDELERVRKSQNGHLYWKSHLIPSEYIRKILE